MISVSMYIRDISESMIKWGHAGFDIGNMLRVPVSFSASFFVDQPKQRLMDKAIFLLIRIIAVQITIMCIC